ncbi:hypothetical protein ABPG73_021793, partial [Tetrahymena malaccensis]
FYSQTLQNQCQPCFSTCSSCSGPSATECLGCPQGTFLKGSTCVNKCGDGYYLSQDKCSQCHPSCKNCQGPNQDQCIECPDILFKYNSKCLSDCPQGTYQEQQSQKQCFSCSSSCSTGCNGPSEKNCNNLKPQNQIIVYILSAKTVIWVISSIVGIIQDQKNKKSQILTVVPKNTIEKKFDFDSNDSPITRKRKKVFADIYTQNITMNDSPIQSTKQNGLNDNYQLPSFAQNEGLQPQFDSQQTQLAGVKDGNTKSEVNLQTQTEKSPKNSYNRRRPRKSQFILNINQKSMNALSSQVNIIDSSPITTKRNQDQSVVTSAVSPFSQSSRNLDKPGKSENQKYLANEKLKYSFLGNEWIELFAFYDPYVKRACRITLIYLKYHMFFFICEYFKFSPEYYLSVCLASGLSMKFIIEKILYLMTKYTNFGNLLSMILFLGALGADFWYWFIPKIQSQNSAFQINFGYHQNVITEYLVSQDFTDPNQSSATGWSQNSIASCNPSSSFVDWVGNQKLNGIFQQNSQQKMYSTLPPHWSLSLRFDLLLYGDVDTTKGDQIQIFIDGNLQDTFTKVNKRDGYVICYQVVFFIQCQDELILYQKNITHSQSSVTIELLPQSPSDKLNKGFGFKNYYLYVDTCDYSCATCNGPTSASSNSCQPCFSSCQRCTGPSADECLGCPQGLYFKELACVDKCGDGYFLNQDKCSQCHPSCKNCLGAGSDSCTECPDILAKYDSKCLSECPKGTYLLQSTSKECLQCSNSCQSDCVGPSDKDCTNLRPRKQIIVYILFSKTVIWVISSLVGMIQDQKNKKAQNLTVVPSNFIENQFNFNNDSPIRKKLKKVPSDVNEALKDQNEDQKKQFGINEKEQLPTFNQNEKFQAQFDNQLDMQAENNDLNGKSEVNLQNQEEQSPKWQYRRRPRKTQFILKANIMKQSQLSMNALSSQVNIIDQSPITSKRQLHDQSEAASTVAPFNQPANKNDSTDKFLNQKYQSNQKLKYSILGNEWVELFTFYDPNIKRSPQYYITVCLASGLGMKLLVEKILFLLTKYTRIGNLLSTILFFGALAADFWYWFIPKIQQVNYNMDHSWSFQYLITFSADFLILQQLLGLFKYLNTVKFLNTQNPNSLAIVSNFKGLMSSFGQSGALTTNCGSNHLLGGFWLSGINSSISRSWTGFKCQSCNGPSAKECLSCPQGSFLQDFNCVQQCADGYYQNQDKCSQCHPQCKTCTGSSEDQCIQCSDLMFKYNSKCLSKCPKGTYYQQASQKECFTCNSSCQSECDGPSEKDCTSLKPQNQIIVYILIAKTLIFVISSIFGLIQDHKNKKSQILTILPSSLTKIQIDSDDNSSPIKRNSNSVNPDSQAQNIVNKDSLVNKQYDQVVYKDQLPSFNQNEGFEAAFESQQMQPSANNIENIKSEVNLQNEIEKITKSHNRRIPRKAQFILRANRNKQSQLSMNAISSQVSIMDQSPINTKRQLHDQIATTSNLSSQIQPTQNFNQQENKQNHKYQYNQKLKYSILGNEWVDLFAFYDPNVKRFCRVTLIYLKYHMFFFICEHFKFSPVYYISLCLFAGLCMKLVIEKILFLTTKYTRFGNLFFMILFFGGLGAELCCWFIPKIQQANYSIDREYLVSQEFTNPSQATANGWSIPNSIGSCDVTSFNQCKSCPQNSIISGNTCTCSSGFIQHQYSCVTSCPQGYVKSNVSNICISDYNKNCNTSDSQNQKCTSCQQGFYLSYGYCVTSCPQTSILVSSTCVDFSSTLINGQYLLNGLFNGYFGQSEISGMGLTVSNFKGLKSYFGQSGALTTNCGTNHLLGGFWLSGSGASVTRIWTGLFLFQNKCLSKCPDGYYQSSADNSCVQCNKSCSTCSSISQCSSCITPFIFFNNQCLSQCPQGYYFSLISNQCKSCSKSCQSCSGPEESQCITCVPGTYLQGTTCLSTCQEGYYQDNTLCSKCSSTCQTCIGPNQDQCLTCQDNLQLFHSQCLNECPSGTYQGKDNQNKCYPCNSSCTLSCSGPSEEECSTIKPQSQIIVYILIAKTVLWIFSSIIGLVKDKNNQESQNLKIIPSSQQSGGKLDQDGESPIILKKQSLFSNNEIQNEDCTQKQGNQIIQSSIQNIQNDELQNQISNQYLPNIEINENTQKGYNRRRPRKIHLILQQKSIKSTVFGVNGFYNYANSTFQSGTENNIKEKSQTYDQQATLQNISPISKSKICILGQEKDIIKKYQANQKFRFSILGNEWVELFTFYDAFVSRATRATLIYLKYHIYIYMCELFKFSPLYFLLLSLACGLGLNCRLMVLAYPQDNQNEPQYGFQLELIIYNYLFCRFSYTIISFRLAQISEHNQFFKQKQQQPWTLQNIQK